MIAFKTKDFDRALAQYAVASRRDFREICDRQGLNLAMRAMQFTPKANAQEIQSLESLDWWPKFIAKRLRGAGAVVRTRRQTRFVQGQYTRAEARAYSKRVIGARRRSVAFIRAGWIPAARRLAQIVGQAIRLSAQQRGRDKGRVIPATERRLRTEIINSAIGASKVGAEALQRAFAFVANDMRQYAEKKMRQTARRHSARR